MSTLFISDRIQLPELMGIHSSSWTSSRPSAEGYDILILDLYFGPPSAAGYYQLSTGDAHFYELGIEVAKSLRGGGIVIALLGPVAVTERDLASYYGWGLIGIKQEHFRYEGKYVGTHETSYDWLDQGFLENTRIDSMFVKQTEGITVVSTISEMKAYTEWTSKYWVSVSGIGIYGESKIEGTITHPVAQSSRWNSSDTAQYAATILAVGKHTRLPVAAAMRYMNWDGVLVLLPSLELKFSGQPGASEEVWRLFCLLESLAKSIKKDFTKLEGVEHEDWVFEHRTPRAKELVSQIDSLRQKENTLEQELRGHDQMLVLLDGTGGPLVASVATLFDKPGILVERTEKGAPIDLFVYDNRSRRLVIEVTGIKGALKKNDPHWSDFLGYMPEHHERNEKGRVERIVLVVNTECKTKLGERNPANDMTTPVENIVTDNHICVIRSCDLYELWSRILEGLTIQGVFDMLFDCDGIFEPKQR